MALAHNVGSAVEQAYRRSDQFEKRRQLAQAWARYIVQAATDGAVVPLRASRTCELIGRAVGTHSRGIGRVARGMDCSALWRRHAK
jgi:hypothetical protein